MFYHCIQLQIAIGDYDDNDDNDDDDDDDDDDGDDGGSTVVDDVDNDDGVYAFCCIIRWLQILFGWSWECHHT